MIRYILAASLIAAMFLLWRWFRPGDLADVPVDPVQTDIYIEDLWMSLFERDGE